MAVAVHRTGLASRFQHQRRAFEHLVNRRVVRLDKGGHHFGQVAQPAPLVARQQLDGVVAAGQHRVNAFSAQALVQRKVQHRRLGLRQTRQQRAVQLHVKVAQVIGFASGHRLQVPCARFDKGRLRGQMQRQPLQRRWRVVDHRQRLQRRHRVLKIRQIELGDHFHFHADSALAVGASCRVHTHIHLP